MGGLEGRVASRPRGRLPGRSWSVAVVGTLAGCVLAAGCTTGATAPPGGGSASTSTASATGSPTSATSSSTSANPTSTSYPSDVPAAARTHDAAGAQEFVRFFVARLNQAWTGPQVGLLPPLCLAQSKACASFEKTAVGLVSKNQRYVGAPLTVRSVAAFPEQGGLTEVDFQGRQEKRDVTDAQGHVVLTDPEEPSHFSILLTPVSQGWLIYELRVVK